LSSAFLILKNSSNPSEKEEGVMLSFTGFFYYGRKELSALFFIEFLIPFKVAPSFVSSSLSAYFNPISFTTGTFKYSTDSFCFSTSSSSSESSSPAGGDYFFNF